MIDQYLLDRIPLWGIFILMVVTVLISIQAGYGFGAHVRRDKGSEKALVIGAVVPAILGLLAFIIGFSFSLATATFNERRQLMLKEVNSIQTAYLWTEQLPEVQGKQIRGLLREYVDLRVELYHHPRTMFAKVVSRSEEIQDELWTAAASIAESPGANKNPLINVFFNRMLLEMTDLQTSRLTAATQFRIPEIVLITIYFLSVISMLVVGYFFGISGIQYRLVNFALAVTFSSVVWLIADLDRASQGSILITIEPMRELQQKLRQ